MYVCICAYIHELPFICRYGCTIHPLGGRAARLTPRPQLRKNSNRARCPLDLNFQREDGALILIKKKKKLIILFPSIPRWALQAPPPIGGGAGPAAVAPARCGGCGRPWPPPSSAASPGAGMAAPGTSRSRRCRPCTWTRSAWVSGAGPLPPDGAPRRAGPQPWGAARGNRWESRCGATSVAGIGSSQGKNKTIRKVGLKSGVKQFGFK